MSGRRVLNVCRVFDFEHMAGIQSVVRLLCRGFTRLGHRANILATAAFGNRVFEESFEDATIHRCRRIYPTPWPSRRVRRDLDLFAGCPLALGVSGIIARHDLVLIHDMGTFGAQVARSARSRGIAHHFFDHGSSPDYVPRARHRQIVRLPRLLFGSVELNVARSDGIFVDNPDQLEAWRAVTPHARHFRNPVDTKFLAPASTEHSPDRDRPLRLLCVGRIDPQLDQLHLLDLLEGRDDVEVTFVGWSSDPAYHARFRSRIAGDRRFRHLEGITAYSAELRSLYHDHDALVMPSAHQSQPLVPLEAMAAGLVVVASDISGLRALVEHGRTGFLYRTREDLDACLERVRTGGDALHELRRNALAKVVDWDVEKVCAGLLGRERESAALEAATSAAG